MGCEYDGEGQCLSPGARGARQGDKDRREADGPWSQQEGQEGQVNAAPFSEMNLLYASQHVIMALLLY